MRVIEVTLLYKKTNITFFSLSLNVLKYWLLCLHMLFRKLTYLKCYGFLAQLCFPIPYNVICNIDKCIIFQRKQVKAKMQNQYLNYLQTSLYPFTYNPNRYWFFTLVFTFIRDDFYIWTKNVGCHGQLNGFIFLIYYSNKYCWMQFIFRMNIIILPTLINLNANKIES